MAQQLLGTQPRLTQLAVLLEDFTAKLAETRNAYDASTASLMAAVSREEGSKGKVLNSDAAVLHSRRKLSVHSQMSASEVLEDADAGSDAQLPLDARIGFTDAQLCSLLEGDGAETPGFGSSTPSVVVCERQGENEASGDLHYLLNGDSGAPTLSSLLKQCT
mmetsp:Transcript_31626/g.58110  ORF Transcript_31626/g.58110 Transcript_31626/m.58110 type:complete len:162 (-) Transcript_31626:17-502(-)